MLHISNLHKTFHAHTPAEVQALRGIALELAQGEFATVIGSNGAGKSTLLNTIAGVHAPDAGARIMINATDITRWPEQQRARMIGRVFQNPLDGTAGAMSVEQNLALALRRGQRRGLRLGVTRQRRSVLRDHLARLGLQLETRLAAQVQALSGGQRQALTLLMATISTPALLLLDEPTAALDPGAAALVEALIATLVAEANLTTLMVTHNMQQALTLGTRTLMMHQGEIVLDLRGAERSSLTVNDLIMRFASVRQGTPLLADDKLLLS